MDSRLFVMSKPSIAARPVETARENGIHDRQNKLSSVSSNISFYGFAKKRHKVRPVS